jgi:hypothetical protein
MSDKTSLTAILRPAGSLLDRVDSSPNFLSENQALVDQMVSSSVSEATKGSTLLAMFGAGAVSRLTRAGVMSLALGEGGKIVPLLTRGSSYAIALANESATFAGIERGFHPSPASFEKDWARAFINLGSLKLLGGAAEGQNLLLQHLVTDLGMVGGQQVGAQLGVVERPQGGFAQQMIQAEVLNWSQKGGMALIHGLSPDLLPMEKSMDLYLRSRESGLFSQGQSSPFFSQLVPESPGILAVESLKPEEPNDPNIYKMFGDGKSGEGGLGRRILSLLLPQINETVMPEGAGFNVDGKSIFLEVQKLRTSLEDPSKVQPSQIKEYIKRFSELYPGVAGFHDEVFKGLMALQSLCYGSEPSLRKHALKAYKQLLRTANLTAGDPVAYNMAKSYREQCLDLGHVQQKMALQLYKLYIPFFGKGDSELKKEANEIQSLLNYLESAQAMLLPSEVDSELLEEAVSARNAVLIKLPMEEREKVVENTYVDWVSRLYLNVKGKRMPHRGNYG